MDKKLNKKNCRIAKDRIKRTHRDEREGYIYEYIRGKEVLDIGCGDISDRFLHQFVHKSAKYALGVELDRNRAMNLRKLGFNIVQGDAQDLDLKRKFDVVIAGDLIEHLTNFDGFLISVKRHMEKDSVLIINTPNVFSFYRLTGLASRVPFHEHTCWFCKDTLRNLLSRYDLEIVQIKFYTNPHYSLKSRIITKILSFFPKYNSNILVIARLNKKIKPKVS